MFLKNNLVKQYLLINFIFLLTLGCLSPTEYNPKLERGDNYTFTSDENDPITGTIVVRDSIGKIRIVGSLKDGKIQGNWKEYFSNGQLKHDRNYNEDKFQDISKEYYKNGQLKWIGKYERGEKSGLHKNWYENGKAKSEIYYINGKIEGLWRQWDKKGALISGINVTEKENIFIKIFNF